MRAGVSEKRLAMTTYDKVRYQLKTPYHDGTTGDRHSHTIFEPLDFIARLAALVPKPHVNLTGFHGVFVRGGLYGVACTGCPARGVLHGVSCTGCPARGVLHQTIGTA
jgi:hypothetical protein